MSAPTFPRAVVAGSLGTIAIAAAIALAFCLFLPWCGCTADRAMHSDAIPTVPPR